MEYKLFYASKPKRTNKCTYQIKDSIVNKNTNSYEEIDMRHPSLNERVLNWVSVWRRTQRSAHNTQTLFNMCNLAVLSPINRDKTNLFTVHTKWKTYWESEKESASDSISLFLFLYLLLFTKRNCFATIFH